MWGGGKETAIRVSAAVSLMLTCGKGIELSGGELFRRISPLGVVEASEGPPSSRVELRSFNWDSQRLDDIWRDLAPEEEEKKPRLESKFDFINEITVEEFEESKTRVKELEAQHLASSVTEVDQRGCASFASQQQMGDCGAHTVAGMLKIQECLEGNWGGNPYPWGPEFNVSA